MDQSQAVTLRMSVETPSLSFKSTQQQDSLVPSVSITAHIVPCTLHSQSTSLQRSTV